MTQYEKAAPAGTKSYAQRRLVSRVSIVIFVPPRPKKTKGLAHFQGQAFVFIGSGGGTRTPDPRIMIPIVCVSFQ